MRATVALPMLWIKLTNGYVCLYRWFSGSWQVNYLCLGLGRRLQRIWICLLYNARYLLQCRSLEIYSSVSGRVSSSTHANLHLNSGFDKYNTRSQGKGPIHHLSSSG